MLALMTETKPEAERAASAAPVDAGGLPRGRVDPCRKRRGALPATGASSCRCRCFSASIRSGANRRKSGSACCLQPGDKLDAIVDLLDQLSLVALAFPAFNDGRSFSKAELLRSRHHFEGSVRATRPGADRPVAAHAEARLRRVRSVASGADQRLEKGEVGGLGLYYQPTAKGSTQARKIFLATRKGS